VIVLALRLGAFLLCTVVIGACAPTTTLPAIGYAYEATDPAGGVFEAIYGTREACEASRLESSRAAGRIISVACYAVPLEGGRWRLRMPGESR
jgi:hypothetical protein